MPVGVQPDGLDGIPVADWTGPAAWVPPTRFFVKDCALREDGRIQALVALVWGDESDRAMAMLMVVPLHEGADPEAGVLEAFEAVRRIVWPVLAGAE